MIIDHEDEDDDEDTEEDGTGLLLFQTALDALYSPLHQSSTPEALHAAAARRTRTIEDMHVYMNRSGLLQAPLPQHPAGSSSCSSSSSQSPQQQPQKSPSPLLFHHLPLPLTLPPCIHITGTKGKGSTSALCESILRHTYGLTTGLFTSPHLVDIRERIRINGRPVSKSLFGRVYWHLRSRLQQQKEEYPDINNNTNNDETPDEGLPVLPGYFRMLTLMSWYIFAHCEHSVPTDDDDHNPNSATIRPVVRRRRRRRPHRAIDVMILEVGMGGRYDATNALPLHQPKICGITALDYDHVRVLGNSLEDIALEKVGIYASSWQCGDTLFVLDTNPPSVVDVMRQWVEAKSVQSCVHNYNTTTTMTMNDDDDDEDNEESESPPPPPPHGKVQLVGRGHAPVLPHDLRLGLAGHHQRDNAELAVALCRAAAQRFQWTLSTVTTMMAASDDEEEEEEDTKSSKLLLYPSLANVSWPGRCQTVQYRNLTLCMDGAHTVQSVRCGWEWFTTYCCDDRPKVLLFTTSPERNPVELLEVLAKGKAKNNDVCFQWVMFVRANTERPSTVLPHVLSAQQLLEANGYVYQPALDHRNQETAVGEEDCTPPPPLTTTTWHDHLATIWNHLYQRKEWADHKDSSSSSFSSSRKRLQHSPQKVVSNVSAAQALKRIENHYFIHSNNTDPTIPEMTETSQIPHQQQQRNRVLVFVTGSLYLVGSVLEAIHWKEEGAPGE